MVAREEYEWYSEELRARLEMERAAGRSCEIIDGKNPALILRATGRETQPSSFIATPKRGQSNAHHLHVFDRGDLLLTDMSDSLGDAREVSSWYDHVDCSGIQVGEPVCRGPVGQPSIGVQNESLATAPISTGSLGDAQQSAAEPFSNRLSNSSEASSLQGNLSFDHQLFKALFQYQTINKCPCSQLQTRARTHTCIPKLLCRCAWFPTKHCANPAAYKRQVRNGSRHGAWLY